MADDLRRSFEELRIREFQRLDDCGQVYLDYTGSGLYAASQLRRHEEYLGAHVLGNPHSENPASVRATEIVESARRDVLEFFHADPDEYVVAFTSNASGALKLVGEAFPFEASSRFTLLRDNHNSVNGIRIYAESGGADVQVVPLDRSLRVDPASALPRAGDGPSLFAFPAQSNFSGVKHPLSLVGMAQELGYRVLLDAAAFVPTSPLDLSTSGPDFACISFYKMFGYPTGVGALIARRDALAELRRPWFAGGTVEYVSVQGATHRLRPGAEGFEDGTLNFLGVAAVPAGLAFLRDTGMARIQDRVAELTRRLLEILSGLRHENGSPAIVLYGPTSVEARGGTVSFNALDDEGKVVPYGVVERAASGAGISVRGGCFCNPGAAEVAFGLPGAASVACFESLPPGAFSLAHLAECLGGTVAVGALRASVGIATVDEDLRRLDAFLRAMVAEGALSGAGADG
jgi:selenocysteine lyase/cysteine desulfurase